MKGRLEGSPRNIKEKKRGLKKSDSSEFEVRVELKVNPTAMQTLFGR